MVPRERALGDDVVDGFGGLITKVARVSNLQAIPSSVISSPESSLKGEPEEDLDPEGVPMFAGLACGRLAYHFVMETEHPGAFASSRLNRPCLVHPEN